MERRFGSAASRSGMAMTADRQSTHIWHPPMAASRGLPFYVWQVIEQSPGSSLNAPGAVSSSFVI